jgi:hypothetical protein
MLCSICQDIIDRWQEALFDLQRFFDKPIEIAKGGYSFQDLRVRSFRDMVFEREGIINRNSMLPRKIIPFQQGLYHDSGEAVKAAANAGCPVCFTVWGSLTSEQRTDKGKSWNFEVLIGGLDHIPILDILLPQRTRVFFKKKSACKCLYLCEIGSFTYLSSGWSQFYFKQVHTRLFFASNSEMARQLPSKSPFLFG